MFISLYAALNAPHDSPLEPFSSGIITCIAHFLMLDLRNADTLSIIAQHLHQRCALYFDNVKQITDYSVILDVVHEYDPLLAPLLG